MMFIAVVATTLMFFIHMLDDPSTTEDQKSLFKACIYMSVINLIVSSIQTISGFILLLGAYQGKAKLVYIWVIANIVTVTLNFLFTVILMFLFIEGENWFFIFGCAVDIYFILVVYSYYREIQNSPVYSV